MAWLSSWAKRIPITIDSGDIDANLTWFPVLIDLNEACVFDEVGLNSKKIAVTQSDGTTQLYVEVEKWTATRAWLWVSRTGWVISSSEDTIIYLYYDNSHADNDTYVGDPNSTPAENVWDANFKLVSHMRDDPDNTKIRDSTLNNNDGTKGSADNPIEANGKISNAQHYTTDYISVSDSPSLNISPNVTMEAWVNPATIVGFDQLWGDWAGGAVQSLHFALNAGKISLYVSSTGANNDNLDGLTALTVGVDAYIAVTFAAGTFNVYKDGATDVAEKVSGIVLSIFNSANDKGLGSKLATVATNPFDGVIDEFRISSVARSSDWIKACYETQRDDLLDFGEEETSSYPWRPVQLRYDYVTARKRKKAKQELLEKLEKLKKMLEAI